ncbi:2-phosphoglycerate kinase [Paenibacillus sp. CF384]|uniref:2-phosphoglycerate kinase n=1 Tax=Paenibacillus sp. CF384 TaxID=1884382 RepID=UPI00089B880A|nr:2-phosphoglycerate kinase [Paenibacillus sp. CF384]SDX13385.1 putative acetyltransferase [Paenibacillus sp. CF384]
MIILISGNSQTGKTLMSQKLLERYHIPYLSIDHLKMGLYRGTSNCGFTPLDSNEHIAEVLWPIIKGIIMTNIENNQHLIIEGCYIMPHHSRDFEPEYADKIISVYLGFSQRYIEENFLSGIVKHRNVIEDRGGPEERSIAEYIGEHEAFRRKCLDNAVHYFEIDHSYEAEMKQVYEYIDVQKKEREVTPNCEESDGASL